MQDPMSTKEKMLLRVREIAQTLDSDLSWIDPARRTEFVRKLVAERDEALEVAMADTPGPGDLMLALRVLAHLRSDPEDAAKANALATWMGNADGR